MFKHIQIVLGNPPVGRDVDAAWINNAEREMLIAFAAPDLLAALLKLTVACQEEGVRGMDSLLEKARQAIIAATGEEP